MPASKNTWNKGLNSDLSKLKSQQDSYLNATNIRVLTDEGTSSLAIENVKGNKLSFKLPTAINTYKLDFSGITGNVIIYIDRIDTDDAFTITDVEQKSNETITNELNTLIQASTTLYDKQYVRAYYNGNYLVIYDFLPQSEINAGIFGMTIVTTPGISSVRTNTVINHTILGWGYYNDNLVIISCDIDSNSESPVGSEGFIWDAKYINQDNTILNIDGEYLNPLYHLKYAGKLDLSRQYAIYKHLKCRYESSEITRLVWTDWHNNLRTCNIADPQIWATPETAFSYLPTHAPQKPTVTSIIIGGTLPVGKYQYFYQLYTNQGAVSTYSPLSNLIILNRGDLTYREYSGVQGDPSGKTPQITITNIDPNYDSIRIGYAVYQTADFVQTFWFDENTIPDNGTYTLVHNGNETDIPIDPSSTIANLNKPPDIFKTIDVVRNRLFAANAKSVKFDMGGVFDTRAYRYNSSQFAYLYNEQTDVYNIPSVLIDSDSGTVSIEGALAPGTNFYERQLAIADSFDLINPFNNEDPNSQFNSGSWITNSQYKYQSNGSTIGGSGPNISYDFCLANNIAERGNTQPQGSPYVVPQVDYNGVYSSEFNDTYTYAGGSSQWLDSPKSPLIETLFTGYSRGEVYRFGIVFFDIYGYPSYANWIGDVKFPFAADSNGSYGLTKETSGTNGNPFFFVNNPEKIPNSTTGSSNDFNMFNNLSNTKIYLNGALLYNYTPSPSSNSSTQFCTEFNAAGTGLTATPQYGFSFQNNGPILFTGAASGTLKLEWHYPLLAVRYVELYLMAPTNPVETQQLGITFYLDTTTPQFQAIKDKISGWSYIRLKRDVVNSTKLGTGYLQPTFSSGSTNYNLLPYEKGYQSSYEPTGIYPVNARWGYDLDSYNRVRLGYQTLISPNLLTKSVGSFIENDYIRFIGRTKPSTYEVKYWQEILSPSFNTYNPGGGGDNGSFMFYVKSNDFDYAYTDTGDPHSVDQALATTSDYLLSDSTWEVQARLWVNKSTTGNQLEASLPPLFVDFFNMANPNFSELDSKQFKEWGTQCEVLKFDGTTRNFPDTSNVFYNSSTYGGAQILFPFYLVSYERFITKQYGGASRAARYANQYILTNHFMPYPSINDAVIRNDVYGGDTYVNYADWQRSNPNGSDVSGWPAGSTDIYTRPTGVAVFFPAECIFNADLNTTANHASVRGTTDPIDISNYTYNPALSQQNTTNVFVSKAFNQTSVNEEPHTIYGSDPKIDNERTDAWRTIFINDSLAVNGNYGEINRLAQFKDRLFYYQNDAVGIAAVDERVLENDGSTTQTQLGIGRLLQRYDYITTETGCKHSFAVETTGDGIYHYDSFINKLFKYTLGKTKADSDGMNPLTDVKGLAGFFRTAFVGSTLKSEDKILRKDNRVGIITGYNSEYNSVYFTFFDENNEIRYTISYNELLDAFESFYDFYPSMYLNMRKRFLSVDPGTTSSVYVHNFGLRNNFYNQWFPSTIKFRVNENSDFVKTFDNFQINTEVIINNLQAARTVTSYSISNDYQIIPETNANFVQKIRSWRMVIPRDETNPALTIKPRISDKYMDVTFNYYDSNGGLGDDTFRLHDVLTEYSMRSKIVPK
jgi:hypothetical protein